MTVKDAKDLVIKALTDVENQEAIDLIKDMNTEEFTQFENELNIKMGNKGKTIRECSQQIAKTLDAMPYNPHYIYISMLRLLISKMTADIKDGEDIVEPLDDLLSVFERVILLYSIDEILNIDDTSYNFGIKLN